MSDSNGDDGNFPSFDSTQEGLVEGSYTESHQFLQDIVENVPIMIFVKEAEELRFTFVNEVGERLIGLDREELLGKNDHDFFPEEQAEFFTQKDREVLEGGEVVDIPKEAIDTDQGTRMLHTKKVPVLDENGEPKFLLGISEDITERVRVRETLEETEERTRLILEKAHEAFVAIDEQGVIIDWNRQAVETFGWERDEAIGRSLADTIVPPPYRKEHSAGMEQFFETGEGPLLNKRVEVPALHREGHEFPIELTITPLEMNGTVTFNGFIHDISERKAREKELKESQRKLRKAKVEAEQANEAKSQFLARMSHEIRTPMNGVTGMLELLRNTDLSRRQREYIELAKESAEGLRELIDDILDLSKIEVGEVELRSVPFDLRDTVADTLQTLAVRAAEKDLELTFFIPREVPDPLIGDPGRLRQVLVNLTSNGIKFTEEGEIDVRVEKERADQREVELHFRVRDTGQGIEKKDRERIFEAFSQAEDTMSSPHPGTGLGLSISAYLVEMMNGEIWVDSEVGEGSTFHFTAEFGVQEDKPNFPHFGPDDLEGLPVLIVDDNATNRTVLERMTENWSMSPTAVSSGTEALEELERAADAGEAYPIVLLDAVMPEIDGFEVARRIVEDSQLSSTRILMLSSAGNRENRVRGREVEIEELLTKPVKQSALLDAITKALEIEVDEPERMRAEPTQKKRKADSLHILLAEDGRVNRRVAVRLLEQRGHEVAAVENGLEAVEVLDEGTHEFDLVLMDVRMPEMDGFEATQEIRAMEEPICDIPIVALTAHAMEGDREQCLEVGMDEYIGKPIQSDVLYQTVESVAEARGGPGEGQGQRRRKEANFEMPFDWERALDRVDGNEETLGELVEIFCDEYPKRLEELRAGISGSDSEVVQRVAHTLKGSLEFFGAEPAVDAAIEMEKLGEEEEFEKMGDALAELKRQIERVIPAMRRQTGLD